MRTETPADIHPTPPPAQQKIICKRLFGVNFGYNEEMVKAVFREPKKAGGMHFRSNKNYGNYADVIIVDGK